MIAHSLKNPKSKKIGRPEFSGRDILISPNPLLQNQKLQLDFKNPFRILEEYNIIDNKKGDKNIYNTKTNPAKAGFEKRDLYKNSIKNSKNETWRQILFIDLLLMV